MDPFEDTLIPHVRGKIKILTRAKALGLISEDNDDAPLNQGVLRRPWRRNRRSWCNGDGFELIFALSSRKYKVYADIGCKQHMLVRWLSIIEPGAGPNFVRADTLPAGYEQFVEAGPLPAIADANGRPLKLSSEIMLTVRLGPRSLRTKFLFCERLAAPAILGCDFNDRFVEAIFPRSALSS